MERWRNRVALVTGASSSIGIDICRFLSNSGMKVIGCAKRVDKIQELALTCPNLVAYKCDMQNFEEIETMFCWIDSEPSLGQVDVCIPNAGIASGLSLLECRIEDFKKLMDINVTAVHLCVQMAVRLMIKKNINDGHIVFISSPTGYRVNPIDKAYSVSKFAVGALVEGWRLEMRQAGKDIRISCVSPGINGSTQEIFNNMSKSSVVLPESNKILDNLPHLLKSQDVASAVKIILELPPHVEINEILMRGTKQIH